ncbi:metallophosphoesterase [Caldicellulosiruptor hydrothermalis 108]|jgi:metallophosphoesterase (TIGR00282 family)|uniref:Metallophosphoesterase n=1 Tax=Caldicellulosiruptor hydrothermalis (strain DSM 18901 / VKM B-2411 / 108) TaxID=632292 RepID=E4QCN9_CALH1|nr:TIGR00282 family metallophosphoesterase [Caldicellulosiruptor hydrothermalis]ADQ07456.1 metallophosphoesterase [Caldicellulosiruptor hydrothermalis 108]
MRFLAIGDVVGRPGRNILKSTLSKLKENYKIDVVIANCENAAGGNGLTKKVADELFSIGIDVMTMGNHVWANKEIFSFIENETRIIRPANYPEGTTPGRGYNVFEKNNVKFTVINLCGRVFMENLDCPFRKIDEILKKIECPIIIVDFHAEATSEKIALGFYVDGRVSCVYGTHTHVQTADEKILPNGTAYITDIGMTGPYDSVLGVDKDIVIQKFTTLLPVRFEVAKGKAQFNGIVFEVDNNSGKAVSIERINFTLEE